MRISINSNYLLSFEFFGEHHNGSTVLFPEHAPEVTDGRLQGRLSGDEVVLASVRIHVVGVDVVASFDARALRETHPRVVVWIPGCKERRVDSTCLVY